MLIYNHSLLHTQCSIHSASASSFSVLVYPVHHLQSLPIPSLFLVLATTTFIFWPPL